MRQKCPACGHENIPGTDHCDKCLHSLSHKDLPQPGKNKLQTLIMTEKVSEFISNIPPILVEPDTSIKDVIERMQALPRKGCVLVCDREKRLLGIATVRDILQKVAGIIKEKDLAKTPVRSIMTPNPEWLDKDAPLCFALHKIAIGKFRHVPILEGGIPVGVVSTRDIIDYLSDKGA